MATALSTANVLSLEDHCRRRVDRQLEESVDQDLDGARGRGARVVGQGTDQAFYDHVEWVLELWQEPRS
jgi:hypothetical protein